VTSGEALRATLIREGLLSPSGRGQPSLRLQEEDHAHARRHLLEYFGQPLVEVEQEQDPSWQRYFQWIGVDEEKDVHYQE
jgi:hypothetical protein